MNGVAALGGQWSLRDELPDRKTRDVERRVPHMAVTTVFTENVLPQAKME